MWDVAVVGAGPAGASTAVALRAAGVDRVVVVDQRERAARPPIGESLPPETRPLLERLGAWDRFVADGHEPCPGSASSWGSDALGYNDFVCNPYGSGWHLDRARFDESLVRHALDAGVDVRRPTRVRGVVRAAVGFGLDVGEDEPITARFVVDATGPLAVVGRLLGGRRRVAHRLTCSAGFLQLPPGSRLDRMTLLEAVEYGWWYAARIPDGRAAVLVATDPATVVERALGTPDGWTAHLERTRHLAPALPGATLADGGISLRSAASTLLEPCAGDGWLAVGDAACSFDPLSSRGIYKALAGGLDAATAIAASRRGATAALPTYQAGVEGSFRVYQRDRAYFYAIERRWPDAQFWRRRNPGANLR